jgi:hypothetical protein
LAQTTFSLSPFLPGKKVFLAICVKKTVRDAIEWEIQIRKSGKYSDK